MARIGAKLLKSLQPAEKDFILWDDALPGFGVRVKSSGAIAFVLNYRTTQGRMRRITLGRKGQLTPDQARARALKLTVAIRDGGDPAAEKRAELHADDVNALLDRYLAEHVRVRNRASTQERVKDMADRLIRPALGKLKVKSVTTADVIRFHRGLVGTPRTANLCLSALSKAFNLAERWGLRPRHTNPVEDVERYPERARERFLSETELAAVGQVMQAIEEGRQDWTARIPLSARARRVAVLRVLALTGMRLSEVLTLQWGMVDLEEGVIFLAEETTKAGRRVQPIGNAAAALIKAQPVIKGVPWVFPKEDGSSHLSSETIEAFWIRIRDRAGLVDVRIHDLRHTVGTYAGQSKANAFMVRDLLGHKTLAMTGRYVGKDRDPVKQLSNDVGNRIDTAMNSPPMPKKEQI